MNISLDMGLLNVEFWKVISICEQSLYRGPKELPYPYCHAKTQLEGVFL